MRHHEQTGAFPVDISVRVLEMSEYVADVVAAMDASVTGYNGMGPFEYNTARGCRVAPDVPASTPSRLSVSSLGVGAAPRQETDMDVQDLDDYLKREEEERRHHLGTFGPRPKPGECDEQLKLLDDLKRRDDEERRHRERMEADERRHQEMLDATRQPRGVSSHNALATLHVPHATRTDGPARPVLLPEGHVQIGTSTLVRHLADLRERFNRATDSLPPLSCHVMQVPMQSTAGTEFQRRMQQNENLARTAGQSYVRSMFLYRTPQCGVEGIVAPGLGREVLMTGTKAALDRFDVLASEAGQCVTALPDEGCSVISPDSIGAESPAIRWVYVLFDLAWAQPPGSLLNARRLVIVNDRATVYNPAGWRPLLDADAPESDMVSKEQLRELVENPPDCFLSEMPDLLRASVLAIDVLTGSLGKSGSVDRELSHRGGKQPARAGTDWRDAQRRLLELYGRGEPYTSISDLAERLDCSNATVQKAIKPNESTLGRLNDPARAEARAAARQLASWQACSKAKGTPRATSMHDVVTDNTEQVREADPAKDAEGADWEVEFERLVEDAQPEERGRLHGLNEEQRRQLVALLREDPDNYDRVLGRRP